MNRKSDDRITGSGGPITGSYNAILDQGCEFEGKLTFEGTVRVDGHFRGEVFSDATLIVGESGKVEADLNIRNLIISGEVVGNVEATEKVEIMAPGVMRGNIKTPNLVIHEGVVFDGSCNMASGASSITRPSSPTTKKESSSSSDSLNDTGSSNSSSSSKNAVNETRP